MPQKFTYYLHDNMDSSERREAMERQGVSLPEDVWEKVGRPFYEVALECEVNNKGEVKILGVKEDK